MSKMMEKVREIQENMKKAQEKLDQVTVKGEAGAGMVVATMNGKKQLLSIEISDEIKDDKELIQDLTVAAVNKAIEEAEEKAKEEMKKSSEGMLPNIPGFDFSKFGGMT